MKKLKNNLIKFSPDKRLYQIPVPIIGLTGGIGTGKSTVAELFRQNGVPVIDADKLVKSIYQNDETKEFIFKHFPQAIENGEIIFRKIREIVFINADAKKLLEDFIYAHMPGAFKEAYKSFLNPTLIVYDVPLLFEKNLHLLIDVSVCVYAPKEMQIERMILRDHITRELAENILKNQIDIEDKKNLSDFVIENIAGKDQLELEFKKFLDTILTHEKSN